jgi:hypothetical protein
MKGDLETEKVAIDDVRPHPKNVRQGDIGAICESLTAHGQYRAIVAQRTTGHILAGNHTWKAAKQLGWSHITTHFIDCDDDGAMRILLADNRANDLASYDDAALLELLRELSATDDGLTGTLFDGDALDTLISDIGHEWEERTPLSDQYGVPPFSTLDTRQGYWQQRRRQWLSLGIESEIGRAEQLARDNTNWIDRGIVSSESRLANGTSVFDPVLTEMIVRWYSAAGDTVLDPFAGGSVRGIVSAMLSRTYIGIDLRAEQIAANIAQGQTLLTDTHTQPTWYAGDSTQISEIIGGISADLVMTCPPYGDLEEYSDDPADLSAMSHQDFITAYRQIVTHTMSHLRDDRFAVFVVGDYRDSAGNYQNFISDTIDAVRSTGAHLYNEAVLINAVGTGAMVAGNYMRASRKIVKLHQNVLVFLKGNAKRATAHCGDLISDDIWKQHLPPE